MSKEITITKDGKQVYRLESTADILDASDGFHTFTELYEHRIALFAAFCILMKHMAWRSKLHADGTMYDGWFIAGVDLAAGRITYHMPLSDWELFKTITELPKAPEWDGATPDDSVKRLHKFVGVES